MSSRGARGVLSPTILMAIDHQGYVCDYSTWQKVLSGGMTLNENVLFAEERENLPPTVRVCRGWLCSSCSDARGSQGPKDTCPFTKQHHTRRMLVKLTHDNWDEWRERVRDV